MIQYSTKDAKAQSEHQCQSPAQRAQGAVSECLLNAETLPRMVGKICSKLGDGGRATSKTSTRVCVSEMKSEQRGSRVGATLEHSAAALKSASKSSAR